MRVSKKLKAYVPEALEHFGKDMLKIRQPSDSKNKSCQVKLDGLQEAVQKLPKTEREKIEKFWGLTGGPNHSKRLGRSKSKDLAYREMRNMAILSLGKLLTLDYLTIYDPGVSMRINLLAKKVNKNGLEISDIECVKYLMAFLVYADNGPKMSFENSPMSVDTDLNGAFFLDEYEVLNEMYGELSKYPDNTINLKLLISFFEMFDFKDMLIIKKSMGIEIPKETLPKGFKFEDIESAKTVAGVRELKERVFPCGAWEVATTLILGNTNGKINLGNFMEELDSIRKDWAKVAKFKNGEKTLKTTRELRTLNVYNIGGLEFTDAYEVMFLYLERNLIADITE